MPIVHDINQKENYPLPVVKNYRKGGNLGSLFSSIVNTVNNNKDLISTVGNIANSAANVANAAKKINDAAESAEKLKLIKEQLKQSQLIREQELIRENEKNKNNKIDNIVKSLPRQQKGDGFVKF